MAEQSMSPERQRFLAEMGEVLMGEAQGMSMEDNGVILGTYGKWIPVEKQEPLDGLFAAMRMVGLDPARFKFQQYEVIAANPHHGGRIDLKFPAQLVVKGERYQGMHQLDLVLRSPLVAAAEIKSYGRG